MADRGRKSRPLSSRICDERYLDYCQKLHKERLAAMKPRVDNNKPKTMNMKHLQQGNNLKKTYLDNERQKEIQLENDKLLDKMASISTKKRVARPWTARSTLDFKPGFYYDPSSSQAFVSDRLIQSPSQPRGGRSSFAKKEEFVNLMKENQKILNAIQNQKPQISALEHEVHGINMFNRSLMLSNYRGPNTARYVSTTPTPSDRLSRSGRFVPSLNATYSAPGTPHGRMLSTRSGTYRSGGLTSTATSIGGFRRRAMNTAPASAYGTARPKTAPYARPSPPSKGNDMSPRIVSNGRRTSTEIQLELPGPRASFSRATSLNPRQFAELKIDEDEDDEQEKPAAQSEGEAVPQSSDQE